MQREEKEIDRLVVQLREKSVSSESEKYSVLLYNLHRMTRRIEILKGVFENVDNPTIFLSILPAYFSGMPVENKEENGTATLAVLKFSRDICKSTNSDYDLLCKIVFGYLEKTRYKYLEIKDEVFEMIDEIVNSGTSISLFCLSLLLTEQPVSILGEVLLHIEKDNRISILEYILEEADKSKSIILQKNASSLLVYLSGMIKDKEVFSVLDIFFSSLQLETQSLRNAGIEALGTLGQTIKTELTETGKGAKEIHALTLSLCTRTRDISVFCRSKAIHSLIDLIENSAILITDRRMVLECILERITDKTQMVRKKAILFFMKALETHPFVLDGGVLSLQSISKYQDTNEQYHRDALEFYKVIQESLKCIRTLLDCGAKGEIIEIIQYISQCTMYRIEEALDLFPYLFTLSWNRVSAEGKNTTDTLAEEIKRITEGNAKKIVDLMIYFDAPTLSYKGIIRELALRGILGTNELAVIFHKLNTPGNHIKHLRLLNKISSTDRSATEKSLSRVLRILSESTDTEMVSECISLLGNLDYRVTNDSEIINLITRSTEHITENTLGLLQAIVDTAYLISTHPDTLVVDILERLLLRREETAVIFAIGHIAIKEAVHLERLEAAWNLRSLPKPPTTKDNQIKKQQKKSISNGPETGIRERRLSLGSRRNSVKITNEEQEEMADKVFFSKEHEIIFGEDSVLAPLVSLVRQALSSPDALRRKVALVSLGKIMAISSEYSTRHMPLVVEALHSGEESQQIIALMIISDSIMAFSSLVGDISHHLFVPFILQTTTEVQATSLVLIRHLLRTGMIRIKEKYWILSSLLLQQTDLHQSTKRLFQEVSDKEGALKILCEVIKSFVREHSQELEALSVTVCPKEAVIADVKENCSNPSLVQPLLEVIKALVHLTDISDLPKKLSEWFASKNDPILTKISSLVTMHVQTLKPALSSIQPSTQPV
ncbi:hypothetical protein NEOKW01_1957 [Nematocida sp. AWRm80]|nr:hypothetical protein NEOKW01_1957 [Nematocida sp. AWRm80]